jgi:hypothetical protein
MNNIIKKQVLFALFLIMAIIQPQNAKSADVLAARNWGTILHYAEGASSPKSALLSTNTTDVSTVVTLAFIRATFSDKKMLVEWKTDSEIDTQGFFLYRAEEENGEYTTQLNPDMKPSTGSAVSGDLYSFPDTSVQYGKTYYYKLTSIDYNGNEIWYDQTASATTNLTCLTNTDCANDLFCDGPLETCQSGTCVNGPPPCTQGQVCDEVNAACISNSSSTSTTVPITIPTSTTISSTTSIINTSTTSPVTTSTTTILSTSTTVPVTTPTSTTISSTTSIINTSTTSPVTTSTTTILSTSATTTTQFSTTTLKPTTTTTRSGPCAAEAVYGENAEETELLRKYRDNILSKTPEGQEIIKTYYKFSPRVTMLLKQRPLLKNKAKTFIDRMLPRIRKKVEESNKE